ncbi:MAG: S-layer homology domain-containing protein [Clostridia bacterium]|nr:S-layer homology domain-containing protein [Clostridia bacterium]
MNKKILSIILVVALCLSVIPVTGIALDKDDLAAKLRGFVTAQLAAATGEQNAEISNAVLTLGGKSDDDAFWREISELFVTDEIKANTTIWNWKLVIKTLNSINAGSLSVTGSPDLETRLNAWKDDANNFVVTYDVSNMAFNDAFALFDGYKAESDRLADVLRPLAAEIIAAADADPGITITGFELLRDVYTSTTLQEDLVYEVGASAAKKGAEVLFDFLSGNAQGTGAELGDETLTSIFLILSKDLVSILIDDAFLADASQTIIDNQADIASSSILVAMFDANGAELVEKVYEIMQNAFDAVYNAAYAADFRTAIAANGWTKDTVFSTINTSMGKVDATRAMEIIHANIFLGRTLTLENADDPSDKTLTIAPGATGRYNLVVNLTDSLSQNVYDNFEFTYDDTDVPGVSCVMDEMARPTPIFTVEMPVDAITGKTVDVTWYRGLPDQADFGYDVFHYLNVNTFTVGSGASILSFGTQNGVYNVDINDSVTLIANFSGADSVILTQKLPSGSSVTIGNYNLTELSAGVPVQITEEGVNVFTLTVGGVSKSINIVCTTSADVLIQFDDARIETKYALTESVDVAGWSNNTTEINLKLDGTAIRTLTPAEFAQGILLSMSDLGIVASGTYTLEAYDDTDALKDSVTIVVEEGYVRPVASIKNVTVAPASASKGESVTVSAILENLTDATISIKNSRGIDLITPITASAADLAAGVVVDIPADAANGYYTITVYSGTTYGNSANLLVSDVPAPTYTIALDTPTAMQEFNRGETIIVKGTTNLPEVIVAVEDASGKKLLYQIISESLYEAGLVLPELPAGTYTLWVGVNNTAQTVTFVVNDTTPVVYTIDLLTPTASQEFDKGETIIVKGTTTLPQIVVAIENASGEKLFYQIISKDIYETGLVLPELPAGTYTLWVGVNNTAQTVTFVVNDTTPVVYTIDLTAPTASQEFVKGDAIVVQGTTTLPQLVIAVENASGEKLFYQIISKAEFEAGYTLPAFEVGSYTLWAGINNTAESVAFAVKDSATQFTFNLISPADGSSFDFGTIISLIGTTNMPYIIVAIEDAEGNDVFYETISKEQFEAGYQLPVFASGTYTLWAGVNDPSGVLNQYATFTILPAGSAYSITLDALNASYNEGDTIVIKGTTNMPYINVALSKVTASEETKVFYQTISKEQFEAGFALPTLPAAAYVLWVGINGEEGTNNRTASFSVIGTETPAITDLSVTPSTVKQGEEITIKANLINLATAQYYIYDAESEEVVVSAEYTAASFATGVAYATTALPFGEYTVYVKNGDVTSEAATFTVVSPTEDMTVSLSPSSKTVKVNQTFTLTATISLPDGYDKDDLDEPEWELGNAGSNPLRSSYARLSNASDYKTSGSNVRATVRVEAVKKTSSSNPETVIITVTTADGAYTATAEMELEINRATTTSSSSSNITTGPVITIDTDPGFSDVPSTHWAFDTINTMVRKGLLVGYPDGTFRPDNYITRAEFATVASRVLDLEILSNGVIYDDTTTHWARDIIGTMSLPQGLGMLRGIGENLFAPDVYITREQAAAIIVRAKSSVWQKTASASEAFSDADSISWWFTEEIDIAYSNNLITGFEDGTYRPQNYTTRAEACTLLLRAWPEYLTD